jgi:hypothetical protein
MSHSHRERCPGKCPILALFGRGRRKLTMSLDRGKADLALGRVEV